MFHLGCFFLIPLIAVAVAGRNRSGARSFVFAAARYAALALAILFLWTSIWFLFGAIPGIVRGIIELGREWCYKEVAE